MLCDLVDSTGLVERLGDAPAVELMRRHDQLVRHLLRQHGGREIDKSDGFLALFVLPVQAVAFALDYQRELRALGNAEGWPLSARVGIHVGDVLLWESDPEDIARGAKPVNVEGVAKPIAARLMQLARPGQILLSQVAEDLVRRAAAELGELSARVHWCDHGHYRIKGLPVALAVHEVGEAGFAPLAAPADTDKARRERPLWRRPAAVVAQAVAASALIAIAVMLGLRSEEAIAFRERDWVVIGSLDNRTGDGRFDDALETALRLSLEQSRHVNVLPDLRVRDALRRMGREPGEPIDRDTGSEIALREGARALLLPSVAEVGGKLRVNLELVDPNSQRTVRVESAQGVGAESALDAVGAIGSRLRRSLGEQVAAIQLADAPLEQATSPSLDALRAYSLGLRANGQKRQEDAKAHFQTALAIDPEFAMAHVAMGRYHFARQEHASALAAWRRAAELEGRLSSRERLSLEGLMAMAERQKDFPERWKSLLELYPDYYIAAHNYALYMRDANRIEEAVEYARRASEPRSITRPASAYMLGYLLLGLDRIDEAYDALRLANSLGASHSTSVMAGAAFAARRQYEAADDALNGVPPDSAAQNMNRRLLELAMSLDRGDWTSVADDAQALEAAAFSVEPNAAALLGRAATVALRLPGQSVDTRHERRERLIEDAVGVMIDAVPTDREIAAAAILRAGLAAAEDGDVPQAEEALAATREIAETAPFSVLLEMRHLVEARIELMQSKPELAIARLEAQLRGDELYLSHVLLADAYAAAGRLDEAQREFQWLASRRGRAYAEFGLEWLLQTENVLQANLAVLREAELALARGEVERAGDRLREFRAGWPSLASHPGYAQRVASVAAALGRG